MHHSPPPPPPPPPFGQSGGNPFNANYDYNTAPSNHMHSGPVRRRPEQDELDEEPVFAAGERKERRRIEHEAKMKTLLQRAESRGTGATSTGSGGKPGLKDKLRRTDYLEYEDDFGKTCFNVVFGILILLAVGLLYAMWFTDYIR